MVALITGASSGLGAEFSRQLDNENLTELWLIARNSEALNKLSDELTRPCRIIVCDLTDETAINGIIGTLLESEKPDIKYCINNAGFGKIGPLHKLDRKDMTAMVDLNCRAVVHLSHMAIPYMAKGSALIHSSSAASFALLGGFAVYASTKSFVTSFSYAIEAELKELGIHSIAVCPGPIETNFSANAHKGSIRSDSVLKKVDAAPVIRKTMHDTKRKRSISVYGGKYNLMRVLSRMLSPLALAKVSLKQVMNTSKPK